MRIGKINIIDEWKIEARPIPGNTSGTVSYKEVTLNMGYNVIHSDFIQVYERYPEQWHLLIGNSDLNIAYQLMFPFDNNNLFHSRCQAKYRFDTFINKFQKLKAFL